MLWLWSKTITWPVPFKARIAEYSFERFSNPLDEDKLTSRKQQFLWKLELKNKLVLQMTSASCQRLQTLHWFSSHKLLSLFWSRREALELYIPCLILWKPKESICFSSFFRLFFLSTLANKSRSHFQKQLPENRQFSHLLVPRELNIYSKVTIG